MSEINPSENICALILGNAGCGKSTALASFASASQPMRVIDCDNRMKGILASKRFLGDSLNYIDKTDYSETESFESIEDELLILCKDVEDNKEKCKFKHLVLDSVTSLTAIFTEDSHIVKGMDRKAPGASLPKDQRGFRITGQVVHTTPADYEYNKTCFRKLFYKYFRHLNEYMNIWMSAWMVDLWGKDPKNPYGPAIQLPGRRINAPPSIAMELPGFFDEIWEFHKEDGPTVYDKPKYTVRFNSQSCKTAIENIALVQGPVELGERRFKEIFDEIVAGTWKQPEPPKRSSAAF